ncbi:hypothetical protein [Paenibacillus turpanensis]|uniref:hypothetical protein n=1 Tax=Paenibacillus turpanensis TaxID=2689078 RepID=UPI00140CC4B8|nr:hypothetical protein [Paenibacillus turpanensis]
MAKAKWKWLGNEKGSFTLEAALVMPVIMLIVISLLLLAVGQLRSAQLYKFSYQIADRTAFSWSNSHREYKTGALTPGFYDPLYWRLTDNAPVRVDKGSVPDDGLPGAKLAKGLPEASFGDAYSAMDRSGLFSYVQVSSSSNVPWQGRKTLIANASITEPAEFIRNTDLILNDLPKYVQRATAPAQASAAQNGTQQNSGSNEAANKPRELVFSNHAEALAYLRTIVKGSYSSRSTTENGTWRMIDALDRDGIAHQVYVGPKTYGGDIKDQLLKDAELVSKGEVKGVVWHFFRKEGAGQPGPSRSLAAELQKKGIMVVIHE